jgi:hypothetical protein
MYIIDYIIALHPIIKVLMVFSLLGVLSLCFITIDLTKNPPPKFYTIKLIKEDLDFFDDDYTMVEVTVEKILKQAKEQGYKSPSEIEVLESGESA